MRELVLYEVSKYDLEMLDYYTISLTLHAAFVSTMVALSFWWGHWVTLPFAVFGCYKGFKDYSSYKAITNKIKESRWTKVVGVPDIVV